MNWRFWQKKPKYECHCMQDYLDKAGASSVFPVLVVKYIPVDLREYSLRLMDECIPFSDEPQYTD